MKKVLSKKVLSIVGMVVGLAFIVVGILSMTGALGGDTTIPNSAPYYYDSGYAQFGADYYSYSVNNAAEAASAARTTAYNLDDIAQFLLVFLGITSILFGLMVMCGFGIVLSTCFPTDAASIPEKTTTSAPIVDETATESNSQE